MKTEILTKDNIDKVVMSYCTDGRAKLLGINGNFDPSFAFSDKYANKQYILLFPNGYGASLVTNVFAYGGYEIALTDGGNLENFELLYLDEDSEYFNDVEGYLSTVEELYDLFDFIRDLKPRKENKVNFHNVRSIELDNVFKIAYLRYNGLKDDNKN